MSNYGEVYVTMLVSVYLIDTLMYLSHSAISSS